MIFASLPKTCFQFKEKHFFFRMKSASYEVLVRDLIKSAKVLDHSKDPCAEDFIPQDQVGHQEYSYKCRTCSCNMQSNFSAVKILVFFICFLKPLILGKR